MNEIKSLKTRDIPTLNKTIISILDLEKDTKPTLSEAFAAKKRMGHDSYTIWSTDLQAWVFTDILCDDLVYQEFYAGLNFVIVDKDLYSCIARGLHYYFNKKIGE